MAHAGDPDAHHSSTSQGLAISPSSVTIDGTATTLTDGKLDLGAEVNDELTAAMVQTLTTGGAADALHSHASAGGGGGGSCYTALGTSECGTGYATMYTGLVLTAPEGSWGSSGNLCVKSEGVTYQTSSSYYEYLYALGSGDRYYAVSGSGGITCAMCCAE